MPRASRIVWAVSSFGLGPSCNYEGTVGPILTPPLLVALAIFPDACWNHRSKLMKIGYSNDVNGCLERLESSEQWVVLFWVQVVIMSCQLLVSRFWTGCWYRVNFLRGQVASSFNIGPENVFIYYMRAFGCDYMLQSKRMLWFMLMLFLFCVL